MLKTSAKYGFGLVFTRFIPKNDDQSIPASDNIIGGAGPFDFSSLPVGVLITAIPVTVKIDDDDAVDLEIDLSGAVSAAAVTAAEVVTALDTAFLAEPLDLDASVDANGRVKIATTLTTSVPTHIQVYGYGAEVCMFGQGFGQKIIKSDSLQSLNGAPLMKEDETITTTDAEGDDTELIIDGYRKGETLTMVDTVSEDWEMLALIEGGDLDSVAGTYEKPTINSTKKTFMTELFYKQFSKGTNNESDIVGYVGVLYRNCKGTPGERANAREFALGNFTITALSHKNADGSILADSVKTEYTVEEYLALNLANV
jgi:hypothetical protein